jgi:hypothetical protein
LTRSAEKRKGGTERRSEIGPGKFEECKRGTKDERKRLRNGKATEKFDESGT